MSKSVAHVQIYTDGACSGNPGPGGYGAIVILDQAQVIELGDFVAHTTNNRMEMTAVIAALTYLENDKIVPHKISIFTDSVYVIRGITQWLFGWKKNQWKNSEGAAVTNQDLWEELDFLVKKHSKKIQWQYVRGHNGDPGNERCDKIAVAFSKKDSIYLYNGSAQSYLFDTEKSPKTEPLPETNRQFKEKKSGWYLSLINGVVTKYQTWPECEAQVKGRPGVKFKKVTSTEEENALLESWGKR